MCSSRAERLALELLALPAAGRALLGRVRIRRRLVHPAIARRRTHVDVNETADRIETDAHHNPVQRLGEGANLLRGNTLDADVHRAALEVVAALLALIAVARDDLQRLARGGGVKMLHIGT